MNLCITLNPCLDKTLTVPAWQPGEHQVRGQSFGHVVGGKGVNVARGLSHLDRAACPALFLGGDLGRLCARLLKDQDHFDPLITWCEAPTREILTVRTQDTAQQTAFFDPNPAIGITERDDFTEKLTSAFADRPDWCAMSGSSPCSVTDDLFSELVGRARSASVRTLVDTYGDCLISALQAAPDIVKMNRRECEIAIGSQLDSPAAVRDALDWIRSFGISSAAITFGARGTAASWKNVIRSWKPPAITVVNPIGAGDAMAAGLIDAELAGLGDEDRFRWAMACAVCSVQRWIACEFNRSDVEVMTPQIKTCELTELLE